MSALTKTTHWEYKRQSSGNSDTFVEGPRGRSGGYDTGWRPCPAVGTPKALADSASRSDLLSDSRWQQREALHIPAGSSLQKASE